MGTLGRGEDMNYPRAQAIARAKDLADLTGQPQSVVRDNGSGTYKIIPYASRGAGYGINVWPKCLAFDTVLPCMVHVETQLLPDGRMVSRTVKAK
jgi:hypothetical protein